ncbi:MAG: hypothetical protein Q8920_15030 [Bacillota bacterium]|nr:hypothetical protein [Bacillota bacterium]
MLIKGGTGSGRTTILQNGYMKLLDEYHMPSDNILVLVADAVHAAEWKKRCAPEISGNIWAVTYLGFVRQELVNFYQHVWKNCPEIKDRNIKPLFLNTETSKYLMYKVIDSNRRNRGMFSGITANNQKITEFLLNNYMQAMLSGIPYKETGTRLYNSLDLKDEVKRQAYMDMDTVIEAYRSKCYSLGTYDNAMTVELFNNCLLKDAFYRENLKSRVKYLMADNMEDASPVQTDLVKLITDNSTSCLVSFNSEGSSREAFGADPIYAFNSIKSNLDEVELKASYLCPDNFYKFSEVLHKNIIEDNYIKSQFLFGISKEPSCELKSEMLEKIADSILKLIYSEGYEPSDIVIISTFADPVTEYFLGMQLENKGIGIRNVSGKVSISENKYVRSLVTAALICHPLLNIPIKSWDVCELLSLITEADKVRCSILSEEICSMGQAVRLPDQKDIEQINGLKGFDWTKYFIFRQWINEYIENEPIPLHLFFQMAFMELILDSNVNGHDIRQVKRLCDSAAGFYKTVSRFNMNVLKEFLEMLKAGFIIRGEDDISRQDINDSVVLTAPFTYLSGNFKNRVTILAGLSSENWSLRISKELGNYRVLSRNWPMEGIYTEEMEELDRRAQLADTMRAIIKRCGEKIITFESVLSSNGFENNGILPNYLGAALGGQL